MKKFLKKVWNGPAVVLDIIWQWRALLALLIITIACWVICYEPRVAHPAEPTCAEESLVLMSTDTSPVPLCYFWVPEGTPEFTTWGNPVADGVYDTPAALILNVTFHKGSEYWVLGVIIIKGETMEENLFSPIYLVTYKRTAEGAPTGGEFWVYGAPDACPRQVDREELNRVINQVKQNLDKIKPGPGRT